MTYGEYGVTRLGRHAGTLRVTADGLRSRFDCECDSPGEEIYRLAAVCGGDYVPLGVMMPEGGRLSFRKSMTKNALRELFPREPETFELILPGESHDAALPREWGQPLSQAPRDEDDKPEVNTDVSESESRTPPEMPRVDTSTNASVPSTPTASSTTPSAPPTERSDLKWLLDGDKRFSPMPQSVNTRDLREKSAPGRAIPEGIDVEKGVAPPIPETQSPAPTPPRADAPAIPDTPTPRASWTPISDPSVLFRERDMELITGEVKGALTRSDDDAMLLAVPISQDEPFPMMPVFCFGEPEVIGGQEYVVFRIKNGLLTA